VSTFNLQIDVFDAYITIVVLLEKHDEPDHHFYREFFSFVLILLEECEEESELVLKVLVQKVFPITEII
jgi:hypothetical protein